MSPLSIFLSAPPISRTLALTAFTFSLLIYSHVLNFSLFYLSLQALVQLPPEIWRLFTCFVITGPNLGILFDTYFLYVYGAKLEIASPRFSQRADFVTYICFICGPVLIFNLLITSGAALASPLALAFITTTTRDTWDQPITFFVVTFPSQYLPYVLLLLTFIVASPQAMFTQATGLVASHLYDLFTGLYPDSGIKENWVPTPEWMRKLVGTQSTVERPYGTATMPATGSGSGAAGREAKWGFGLDLGWKKRFGPGRTLGGEGDGESSAAEAGRPTGALLAAYVMGGFLLLCAVSSYLYFYRAEYGWLPGGVEGTAVVNT